MLGGEDIRLRRQDQQMSQATAAQSIENAARRQFTLPTLVGIESGRREPPDWLRLEMIDWKHLPERIAESFRHNPIVRIDRKDAPGEPVKLHLFRKNGDEQIIDHPLQVIEIWTKHRFTAAIVNSDSKRLHDGGLRTQQKTRAWEE